MSSLFNKDLEIRKNTTIDERLNDTGINIKDFGAKGDGVTDDTLAITKAVAKAGIVGGIVFFPPTSAGYVIAGTINVPSNVKLIGVNTKIILPSSIGVISTCFWVKDVFNVTIDGFKFIASRNYPRTYVSIPRNGLSSNRNVIRITNSSDTLVTNCYASGAEGLIKADTNSLRTVLTNLVTVDTHQPIYFGDSDYLIIDNVNLGTIVAEQTDTLDHAIYLANTNHVQASNVTNHEGNGESIQIYNSARNIPLSIQFNNVTLKNVRGGIVVSTARGVNFTNVVVDGINSSDPTSKCWVVSVREADCFIENLQVYNIGNLQQGFIFHAGYAGINPSRLHVSGGYISSFDSSSGFISSGIDMSEIKISDVIFDRCEAQFYSTSSSNAKRLIIDNCIFRRNSSTTTSPIAETIFRQRGTEYVEISDCVIFNDQVNDRPIFYSTDSTGIVLALRNKIKGDTVLISSLDTKTIMRETQWHDGTSWVNPRVVMSGLPVATQYDRGTLGVVKGNSGFMDKIYGAIKMSDDSCGWAKIQTDLESIVYSPNKLTYRLRVSDAGVLSTDTLTVLYDFVDRANSTTGSGIATSGQSWSNKIGTWGVISNQLYSVTDTDKDMQDITNSLTDYAVSCDMSGYTNDISNNSRPSIVVRKIDNANYIFAMLDHNRIRLIKRDTNSETDLASGSFTMADNTFYTVKVTCQGNSIQCTVNNILVANYTLTSNEMTKYGTVTGIGTRLAKVGTPLGSARWKRFVVDKLS